MRDHVLAGEVAAIMNADSKASPWTIWNKMSQHGDASGTIGERGRWQARLAFEIACGICEDHGHQIEAALDPIPSQGILPPRAWLLSPSAASDGERAILVVTQRTQQMMFGWQAPSALPEKQALRLYAAAIAYGVRNVMLGVLIDGYQSQLYRLALDDEMKKNILTSVQDMLRAVRDDDEPVVDYQIDRSAIRSSSTVRRPEASKQSIAALIEESEEISRKLANLKGEAKPLEARKDTITTMLIDLIGASGTIDIGRKILNVEDAKGMKTLKITNKALSAESLF
ncbi:MAG: hypothetical protein CL949_07165 [Erythrobacter sp.]|nr:hypothetical protein [Erythrobacter sp.]